MPTSLRQCEVIVAILVFPLLVVVLLSVPACLAERAVPDERSPDRSPRFPHSDRRTGQSSRRDPAMTRKELSAGDGARPAMLPASQAVSPPRATREIGRQPVPWRTVGMGAGFFGSESLTAYLHPAFGETLVAADIVGPLAIAVTVLIVILRGSNQTVERIFRLLRWIANRPEPPAPGPSQGAPLPDARQQP